MLHPDTPTPTNPAQAPLPDWVLADERLQAAWAYGWNGIATSCAKLTIPFDPAAAWRAGFEMAQRKATALQIKALYR